MCPLQETQYLSASSFGVQEIDVNYNGLDVDKITWIPNNNTDIDFQLVLSSESKEYLNHIQVVLQNVSEDGNVVLNVKGNFPRMISGSSKLFFALLLSSLFLSLFLPSQIGKPILLATVFGLVLTVPCAKFQVTVTYPSSVARLCINGACVGSMTIIPSISNTVNVGNTAGVITPGPSSSCLNGGSCTVNQAKIFSE